MSDQTLTTVSRSARQRRALIGIATSQLLVLTLWFSAAAVAPQLQDEWVLSVGQASFLTLAVQIGFVVGAFTIAVTGLADSVPSRRLFGVAAVAGALTNAAVIFVTIDTVPLAFALRAGTGVALAGVYPSGMKAMAGWFDRGRGMALGVLVGALTVGSAGPHLIRGIGLEWQGVLVGASLLALVGAAIMVATVLSSLERAISPFSLESFLRFSVGSSVLSWPLSLSAIAQRARARSRKNCRASVASG